MRSGFQNSEFRRGTVGDPEAVKAAGEESSENGSDRDAGHEIAFFGDGAGLRASVISKFRMVEGLRHEV